jgi:hypothetical protein
LSGEASWVDLALSEPALLDASMAISLRHSPGVLATRVADWYTYRAVGMVNKRLDDSPEKLTDGLVAAVFTLSYCEVKTFSPKIIYFSCLMSCSFCGRTRWLVTSTSRA